MPTNPASYTRERERKNYKKRYEANKKKQVASHKARRMMERAWKVKKWDWKEVNHKKPQAKWGKTVMSNLEVTSRKENRSKGWKLKDKMYNKKK